MVKQIERSLVRQIQRLEKQSALLRKQILRQRRSRLCLENITTWVKLITVVISLMLLLWTISPSLFNIK